MSKPILCLDFDGVLHSYSSGWQGADAISRLVRSLTPAQRAYTESGSIHGDCTMQTVRALQRKGLFHLVISSPNGRAGFMELTPVGIAVGAILRAKAGTAQATDLEPLSPSPQTPETVPGGDK